MRSFWRRGDAFVWFTGAALALCLLMIAGLVGIIAVNGLGVFWPGRLTGLALAGGEQVLGQVVDRQAIPGRAGEHRIQLKVANRDAFGLDYRWLDEERIESRALPSEAVVLERVEWGDCYGYLAGLVEDGRSVVLDHASPWEALQPWLAQARGINEDAHRLERGELADQGHRLERLRRDLHALERTGDRETELAALRAAFASASTTADSLTERLATVRREAARRGVVIRLANGEERQVLVAEIVRAYRPNRMSWSGRLGLYLSRAWGFVSGEPRESNTEGGIFPAIFGTVMMVMLMCLAAVPFGVLAALYLREYARQGAVVRVVRIAVNNLAGVPSIVFGMFGLGFFVYGLGAGLDRLFYADALPSPTFGTGGILWASLTLSLLTVPVVIVATEEALAAVPREAREGALALGSTQLQALWRVVLPSALPGILTGVILAIARGAGEVAPLMITGVVKLAPDLPVDGVWPFFHLERKFMHLGFHIYDVGFQSPNVEAARPMVYTTALLLLGIVLLLNLTAIVVRNRLRRRLAGSAF
ncbi:MAG: phosphate ABC transporter permease PstA [Candidatus Latescibacterota bacterium]|jgi:phosphate transport system permease protein